MNSSNFKSIYWKVLFGLASFIALGIIGSYFLFKGVPTKWTKHIAQHVSSRILLINPNRLIVVTSSGLIAIRTNNGATIWSNNLLADVLCMGILNGRSVVWGCSSDGQVFAADSSSGRALWESQLNTWTIGMTYTNGNIYLTGDRLWKLDAQTGHRLWSRKFDQDLDGSIIPIGDRVIVSTNHADSYVMALSSQNGAILWRQQFAGNSGTYFSGFSPIHVSSSSVAFQRVDNTLVCINTISGKNIWKKPLSSAYAWASDITNNMMLGGGKEQLIALDSRSGRTMWTRHLNSRVRSQPAIGGGIVCVQIGKAEVAVVDETTGKLLAEQAVISTRNQLTINMIVGSDGLGFPVVGQDGSVYVSDVFGNVLRLLDYRK